MTRLAAIDLDGTLLRSDGSISARTIAAIAAAQDAGVTIVLVTARHWLSVRDLAAQAGARGFAVCSNGALVYDLDDERIRDTFAIETDMARAFVDACRGAIAGVGLGWDTPHLGVRDEIFDALCVPFLPSYQETVRIADHIADDHSVIKLHVGHPEMGCDELLAHLDALGDVGVQPWNSGGLFVDCTAPMVTKAHTLEIVCDRLDVAASDVVAIGDQPADLPMLRWAGRAVAMANAHGSVLDEITERTSTNDEDGVARILEALVTS